MSHLKLSNVKYKVALRINNYASRLKRKHFSQQNLSQRIQVLIFCGSNPNATIATVK